MTHRQQVLVLWLASPVLDAHVLGWSFYDGAAGTGPGVTGDPPYPSGLAALEDGWRLLHMSPPASPVSGHERETSHLKHEFVLERLVEMPPTD